MKFFRRFIILSIALFVLLFAYYHFWFLRLPDRNIPTDPHVFVSPANGRVVSVRHWDDDTVAIKKKSMGVIHVWTEDVDTAGTLVSIQMDVTNVHYQRAPTGGTVVTEKYVPGSFNNAVSMSNEYGIRFENEHNEMLLSTASGKKYKVVQIAGFLARRVITYVKPGDQLKQGDVIGLIKLGSQVTVIFPHDVQVAVKKGDVVVDGESILATDK